MKIFCLLLISIFLHSIATFSQPWFPEKGDVFRTDVIPRIDITIHPDTLQWIYEHVDSDEEFRSLFVFSASGEVDSIEQVGFRLRGNTSRYSAKKSFKLSFNTFERGRKFHGLEKMNLNGEHNDPTISRAFVAWGLFSKMQVPGSRSNHVEVYINNQFFGLYLNVEHVDEEFAESRYANKVGNLYKCLYPANLSYLGTDKETYKNNGYELQTNNEADNFDDIIQLTAVLKNTSSEQLPQNLEPIFNVNGFLRYLAVEIFTGHWDAYSFNQNNFYLYNNPYTGKFEFIPYDVDNTFGIDWFGIDWGTRDIYHWWSDWGERPLTIKVFGNSVYRDRFSFLMNELITNYAATDSVFPQIDSLLTKISPAAESDVYRTLDYGWDFNEFNQSFTEALGAHVKYGLKPYFTTRITSIKSQLQLNPIAPIIENVYHNFPLASEAIEITAWLSDDEPNTGFTLVYQINDSEPQTVAMVLQKGNCYKGVIPAIQTSGLVTYYLLATDQSNQTTREPYSGNYTINFGISTATLVINEIMAANTQSIVDNYGQTSDWIELKNNGAASVSLKGKYLSDEANDRTKWQLPDVTLEPGGFYLVWADDDTRQGENHANFKLSQNGEFLGIFDSYENQFSAIDTLSFTPQTNDISYGLNSNGTFSEQDFITPQSENGSSTAAYITMNFNMTKQIADGNFIPASDFLDIAGTFNDWQGSQPIYDSNDDGIYSITLFNFTENTEIEYKARMNADWGTAEFSELGGNGNRKYTVLAGQNTLNHWYNDQVLTIFNEQNNTTLHVFPNPSNGTFINIEDTGDPLGEITIYNLQGKLVYTSFTTANDYQLKLLLKPGLYLLSTRWDSKIKTTKILIGS